MKLSLKNSYFNYCYLTSLHCVSHGFSSHGCSWDGLSTIEKTLQEEIHRKP